MLLLPGALLTKKEAEMASMFSGKVVLVGGASRGLGYACARAFAREGARLAIVSRDGEAIDAAAASIAAETGSETVAVAADLSTATGVKRFVDAALRRFGGIDVLVTNTGGPPAGPFAAHDDAAWQEAFDGLLMSVVRLCRAVVPIMRRRGGGRIIHNASFTVKEPEPGLVLSNALRAAVVAVSKTLARELAGDGIAVNCVAPGPFATERMRQLIDDAAARSKRSAEEVRDAWIDRVPGRRLLSPEELAEVVLFLSSKRASGITGAVVPVDGGLVRSLL